MNPEYMRAAWMREVENNILFGMTTDEMLVRGLGRDSHQLPHFAGVHVFPVFPGAAAQCVPFCLWPCILHLVKASVSMLIAADFGLSSLHGVQ